MLYIDTDKCCSGPERARQDFASTSYIVVYACSSVALRSVNRVPIVVYSFSSSSLKQIIFPINHAT